MDKLDFWKKYPCVFVGAPFQHSPEANFYANSADVFAAFTHTPLNFYFFLHLPEQKIEPELLALQKKGVQPDQIFLLHTESFIQALALKHGVATVPLFGHEEIEEFRIRVLGRVEVQRQEKFQCELEWLRRGNFFDESAKPAECRALERARLTHSLASSLRLSPINHANALRWAFFFEQNLISLGAVTGIQEFGLMIEKHKAAGDAEPWPADFPIELLLVESAELALRSGNQTMEFRKSFRTKSSLLSFKLRSDLKSAIETCFLHVWEDQTNAA